LRFLFYHWLLITLICDVKININQLILGRLNSYSFLERNLKMKPQYLQERIG